MQKIEMKFAKVLAAIGNTGQKTEQVSAGLLRLLRENKVRTVAELDPVITQAYAINGWNTRKGRPTGDKRDKVPHTVRTYVWEMRSAMRDGLPAWSYATFYDMRVARGKLRHVEAKKTAVAGNQALPALPELKGVQVGSTNTNGALLHDLILLFAAIPDAQRVLLAKNLERLMSRYTPAVAVIAEPAKKRATG
jgi:hypothetical protein